MLHRHEVTNGAAFHESTMPVQLIQQNQQNQPNNILACIHSVFV
jgi:hypothetical protein